MKTILKSVQFLDWLIIAAAVFLLTNMDYANLTTVNIIYLVSFAIWLVLFVARIYIIAKRNR